MNKKKSIFHSLRKRPNSVKHKKQYIELESEEYEEYEEDEFYDDEYSDEYSEEEYDEEYYDEYSEEEYDEEYYDEAEYEEAEYVDEDEVYDEEYYDDQAIDEEEYYEDGEYEEEVYEDYSEYDNEEEYYEDEYYEEEYADEEYDAEEYPEEYYEEPVKKDKKSKKKFDFKEWVLDSICNLDFMDVILLITTTLLVIFGVLTVTTVTTSNNVSDAIESFVPIGNKLAEVGIIGEQGIANMVEAGNNGLLNGVLKAEETAEASENTEATASEENTQTEKARVHVNFESVEKDVKIRFKNSLTGDLITGTAFEVTITNKSSGNSLTLVDDDKDGVIYKSGIKAGKFNAVISSTDKYKFPTDPQEITIKDKVEYVVINVEDEVKKEADIEVAKEDTEIKVAATETIETPAQVAKDTVEFVNPTKTPNKTTYSKIDKDKIADPSLKTSAISGSVKFDDFTFSLNKTEMKLKAGDTETLTTGLSDGKDGDLIIKYVTTWTVDPANTEVISVDKDGKVTALKVGTAKVKCYVVKSVTNPKATKTEKGRYKTETKRISVEEYEKLSDEEKKYCEPIEVDVPKNTPEAPEAPEVPEVPENVEEAAQDAAQKAEEALKDIIPEKPDDTLGGSEPIIETEKKIVGYNYTPETEKEVPDLDNMEKTYSCTQYCNVTVDKADSEFVKSASLELSATQVNLAVGATQTITPTKLTYTMNDGSTKTYTSDFPTIIWTPSDISIATVSDKGVITAVKSGSTTIKATLYNTKTDNGESISQTVNVTVGDGLSLTLDKTTEQTLKPGETVQLNATVKNQAKDASVTWTSSDEKIAKVSNTGLVTAVAAGNATITCTTVEKNTVSGKQLTATCPIKVVATAASDKTSKLKDKSGNQVYVKDSNGNYVEAVYADYYTAKEFFLMDAQTYTYTGWQTLNGKTYYYDKNGKAVTGTQVIQSVSYEFLADGSLKTSANGGTRGIDVSKWNGSIDWTAVKNSGIDYVIVRCGYRGSSSGALIEDVNFKTNMQGATAAGLKVGIYFFSQAIDEVEAVKEASFAISLAQSYRLTYPIFIDTEKSGGRADSLGKDARTAIVNAFCQTVENAGYKAGIYASQTWYEQKLNMANLQKYKIWLARYADTVTYEGKYDMWQYTAKGTVSGISGKVDVNYSYLGY